jgi:hypothetical protein|tara:strand:+ start:244 stop:519 length:276 start_codon:yes stop_codon:yes gene_type:complete
MKAIAKTALISATLFSGYYYGNKFEINEELSPPNGDFFENELSDILINNGHKTQERAIGVPSNECIVSEKDLTYDLYAQECLNREHAWFKI